MGRNSSSSSTFQPQAPSPEQGQGQEHTLDARVLEAAHGSRPFALLATSANILHLPLHSRSASLDSYSLGQVVREALGRAAGTVDVPRQVDLRESVTACLELTHGRSGYPPAGLAVTNNHTASGHAQVVQSAARYAGYERLRTEPYAFWRTAQNRDDHLITQHQQLFSVIFLANRSCEHTQVRYFCRNRDIRATITNHVDRGLLHPAEVESTTRALYELRDAILGSAPPRRTRLTLEEKITKQERAWAKHLGLERERELAAMGKASLI